MEWLEIPITLEQAWMGGFKKFYLNKCDIMDYWVGHSQLKESDTIDLFEGKHMNE